MWQSTSRRKDKLKPVSRTNYPTSSFPFSFPSPLLPICPCLFLSSPFPFLLFLSFSFPFFFFPFPSLPLPFSCLPFLSLFLQRVLYPYLPVRYQNKGNEEKGSWYPSNLESVEQIRFSPLISLYPWWCNNWAPPKPPPSPPLDSKDHLEWMQKTAFVLTRNPEVLSLLDCFFDSIKRDLSLLQNREVKCKQTWKLGRQGLKGFEYQTIFDIL